MLSPDATQLFADSAHPRQVPPVPPDASAADAGIVEPVALRSGSPS